MERRAKLFFSGRSQAVRLPAEFRFEGNEVFIRKDASTGDLILSSRPNSWQEFFKLRADVPKEFLSDRGDESAQERQLF